MMRTMRTSDGGLARLRRKGIVNSMGFGERHLTQSEKKLGFRIHAMVFVPTIVVPFIINLLIGSPYWSLWVLLGWGIGLFCHWFFVLGPGAGKAETT
jgi:hypothetical protein